MIRRTVSSRPRRLASAALGLLAVATAIACGTSNDAGDFGPDGSAPADGATTRRDDTGAPVGDDDTTPPGDDASPPAGDDAGSPVADAGPDVVLPAACNGSVHTTAAAGSIKAAPAFTLPAGFAIETIASVGGARELAALPNGDLLVATNGKNVYLVPNAEAAGAAGAPVLFTSIDDSPAQGVTFAPSTCTIYVGTQHGVYSMAYVDGQKSAPSGASIASLRSGTVSPTRGGDTDLHTTTSVAFANGKLYAAAGSSCNACVESDPTRAAIQVMDPNGANMKLRATRIRNAIALVTNPATGTVWAGGAGQDNLTSAGQVSATDLGKNHPFEFFDAVTLHGGVADYGWPFCEENHHLYAPDAGGCAATVAPLVELPAYSTIIGAAFYPAAGGGAHAFPATYRGGLFLSVHGSWHTAGSTYAAPPRVAFVPMSGDAPKTAVDWTDPTKQWTEFVGGIQSGSDRLGRPTGVAVGSQGSLFVADDTNGTVYRIRPK